MDGPTTNVDVKRKIPKRPAVSSNELLCAQFSSLIISQLSLALAVAMFLKSMKFSKVPQQTTPFQQTGLKKKVATTQQNCEEFLNPLKGDVLCMSCHIRTFAEHFVPCEEKYAKSTTF